MSAPTERTTRIIGNYHVVMGTASTTDGKFAPVFEVWEGPPHTGRLAHRQDPASTEKYATESDAYEAAARMAGEWIDISAGI